MKHFKTFESFINEKNDSLYEYKSPVRNNVKKALKDDELYGIINWNKDDATGGVSAPADAEEIIAGVKAVYPNAKWDKKDNQIVFESFVNDVILESEFKWITPANVNISELQKLAKPTPKWIKAVSYETQVYQQIVLHTTSSFYSWNRDTLKLRTEVDKILPYLIKELPDARYLAVEDEDYDIKSGKWIKNYERTKK